jgi:hypothetical protein
LNLQYNGKDWDVLGENWSQLNIYKHKRFPQYRLVGWSAGSLQVILNIAITHNCKIKKKSQDFYKYIDEDNVTWGFGFCVKGDSAALAYTFTKDIHRIIKELDAQHKLAVAAPRPAVPARPTISSSSPPASQQQSPPQQQPQQPQQQQQQPQQVTTAPAVASATPSTSSLAPAAAGDRSPEYVSTVGTLGQLQQRPGKAPSHNAAISQPFQISHDKHVSFSPTQGFQGLPAEWAREMERQFGIEAKSLPGQTLPGLGGKVPQLLISLRQLLVSKGGLEAEGIFRLAPDKADCARAKDDIDAGKLLGGSAQRDASGMPVFDYDVHVIANLIKTWLRDLPTKLLPPSLKGRISVCDTGRKAWDIVEVLAEPYRSILIYLLDMFVEVCERASVNKMTPQNVAICVGPNLFEANDADIMATITHTKKVADLIRMLIEYRMENKK